MAAKYYEVDLDANGALELTAVAGATPSADADDLAKRFQALFDKIRVRVPATPGRAAYLAKLIDEQVKPSLEDGDLARGKTFLSEFDLDLLKIRYFKIYIDEHNGNLHAAPAPWLDDPTPPDVRAFVDRLDNACRKIKLLVPDAADRARRYKALESYGKHGLEEGQVVNATLLLQNFEKQFVAEEGPGIRKRHLISTMKTAFVTLGILAVVCLGLKGITALPGEWQLFSSPDKAIKPIAFLTMGVCLGIVFFAFVRNLTLTFDSLGNFDPAQLAPALRFTLVGVITALLCLLMSAGLITLEINELKLHEYANSAYEKNAYAAIIVGVLCGYSDTAITQLLTGVLDRK